MPQENKITFIFSYIPCCMTNVMTYFSSEFFMLLFDSRALGQSTLGMQPNVELL